MLVLKTIHVLCAVLYLGAGLGSVFYKLAADRSGDPAVIAWAHRSLVKADWLFTVPSGLLLPVTGLWLAHLYGLPWTTPWVLTGIVGWTIAGIAWHGAAVLQLRMRDLAERAYREGTPLPPAFHRAHRLWLALGVPAFLASVVAVWAMVAKWAAFSWPPA